MWHIPADKRTVRRVLFSHKPGLNYCYGSTIARNLHTCSQSVVIIICSLFKTIVAFRNKQRKKKNRTLCCIFSILTVGNIGFKKYTNNGTVIMHLWCFWQSMRATFVRHEVKNKKHQSSFIPSTWSLKDFTTKPACGLLCRAIKIHLCDNWNIWKSFPIENKQLVQLKPISSSFSVSACPATLEPERPSADAASAGRARWCSRTEAELGGSPGPAGSWGPCFGPECGFG